MDRYSVVNGTVQVLRYAVSAAWLIPAVAINLEMAHGKGYGWTAVAIGSVLGGACAVEFVRHVPGVAAKFFWSFVAMVIIGCNIQNGIRNAAMHSGGMRESRLSQQQQAGKVTDKLKELRERRKAQVKIAGEIPVASFESDIQARIAKDANRWRSSAECSPALISAGTTREFCEEVSAFRAKKAAAEERLKLDTEITLWESKDTGSSPISADPGTDSIAAPFDASEGQKRYLLQ